MNFYKLNKIMNEDWGPGRELIHKIAGGPKDWPPEFKSKIKELKDKTMNPEKHTSDDVLEHTQKVVKRALELANMNNLNQEEKKWLVALAWVHDIGKAPSLSVSRSHAKDGVAFLKELGIDVDGIFLKLVENHDVNLNYFLNWINQIEKAMESGEIPHDDNLWNNWDNYKHGEIKPLEKTIKKLHNRYEHLDEIGGPGSGLRILILLMIADRIDCPGCYGMSGAKSNSPLQFFLYWANHYGYIDTTKIEY